MPLFDKLKNSSVTPNSGTAQQPAQTLKTGTEKIVFSALPETLEGFKALPQAAMATPFDTAAMTVLALCFYPEDKELSLAMLDHLRGPRPMNGMDKQLIADRFRDKDYVPRSYFEGAKPENNYLPDEPYTVSVTADRNSYLEEGYAKLFIPSGGADSPRPIKLRLAKDGKWYLWEQALLTGIRAPESSNPWV